ncbi:Endo-1,4-beta-xylanase A precursor [compost metagenome]
MKKSLGIILTVSLVLCLFSNLSYESAAAAPETEMGTVHLSGDPSFDSDSIANNASNQWRWLSYPGARFSLNPNKGSVSIDQGSAPMSKDLAFNIGGFLGDGQVQFFSLMNAKIAAGGQTGNEAASVNTTWYPYKITFNSTYNTPNGVTLSGYDYFTDADSSVVRVIQVNGDVNKDLILGGKIESGATAAWDSAKQSLIVSHENYYYALTFNRLIGEELTAQLLNIAPEVSGSTWSLKIPVGSESGNYYAVGFGFAAREEGMEKAASRASGNFARGVKESLGATKQVFDTYLQKVPTPQSFGIPAGIDNRGVTAEQHRTFYYGAFAFFLNNYMNVLPENTAHFNYPQVVLGKASTWGFGAPYNSGSVAWESFLGQQWLSYMMPREAWEAYTGTMSLVGADGYIPGEVLPARKAQAAWVIYKNGGATKEELAAQYESIRRNLLWLEQNPRWIYIGHDSADEKDLEFMASFLFDADFAMQIAREIGQPESEVAMWEAHKGNVEKDIREWFLTNPNELNQYYFLDSKSYRLGEYESILNAIYSNSLTDQENRMLMDYWRGMANANAPVNGQFFKYGVMSLNVYAMYNKGFKGDARQIVYTAIRDTIKAGNFSENIQPSGNIEGVSPSTFTAAAMIDFTLMANGLESYTGEPQAIDLGNSWGENALPDLEDFTYGSDWTSGKNAKLTVENGIGTVKVSDNASEDWGHVAKRLSYNVNEHPELHVKVTQVSEGGKWALKVSDGGNDIELQKDIASPGEYTYDLKTATGWSGNKSFVIKLYASGGKGKSFWIDYVGTEGLSGTELALDKQAYAIGQSMKVSYRGVAGEEGLIGIVKDDGKEPSASNPPLITKPVGALPDGTIDFDIDWAPGNYRVVLLKDSGYTVDASVSFKTLEPSAPGQVYLEAAISSGGWMSGRAIVSPPLNSTYVEEYSLYWGNRDGKLPGALPVATIPAAMNDVSYEFVKTPVPEGATTILAYSKTKGIESFAYAFEDLPQSGLQPLLLEDFYDVSDWTEPKNASITADNGMGRIAVTGGDYGHVDKILTYNVTDYPLIRLKIDGLDSGAKWAMKVNTGHSFNNDITIQADTTQTGEIICDLRKITGWKGPKSFTLMLYAVGGSGKGFNISELTALPAVQIDDPLTVPGVPTEVSAIAGDGSAVLSFDPPADNGGSEILGYTVTAWTSGGAVKIATGSTSPITVTGLTNGTAYTFTVIAANAQGESAASAPSNEVIPSADGVSIPTTPTNLTVMPGDESVALSWNPAEGAVTYAVYQYEGPAAPTDPKDWILVRPTVTEATYNVTGLTNGTTYTFAVKAANAEGESGFSVTATATPGSALPPAPAAPRNLRGEAGNKQVVLKWDGAADADSYTVYQYLGASAPTDPNEWELVRSGITETTYRVTGLANETKYTFSVKAANAGGISDFSAAATVIPKAPVPETPDWSEGGSSGSTGNGSTDTSVIQSTNGTIIIPAGRAGEVRLGDEITVTVPVGAAAAELRITVKKLTDLTQWMTGKEQPVSGVYELLKNYAGSFGKPLTLAMKFDPSLVGDNQRVAIFYYDEAKKAWIEAGGIVNGNRITAEVDHFAKFAVLAVDEKKDESSEPKVPTFADIAGHWAKSVIQNAADMQLVNGYRDGTFKPNAAINRAEFTVMLVNALKLEGTGSATAFTDDAQNGGWAKQAIANAVEAGIVSGYADGSFRPNAGITRAEMAAMVARALQLSIDVNVSTSFADDAAIPQWAKGAVEAVRGLGILNGRDAGKFAPNDAATRAEAVVMLLRMLEQQDKQ